MGTEWDKEVVGKVGPQKRVLPWRRKWPPTPIFLLRKSHGQRSLRGYSLQCHKESGMTKYLGKNGFSFLDPGVEAGWLEKSQSEVRMSHLEGPSQGSRAPSQNRIVGLPGIFSGSLLSWAGLSASGRLWMSIPRPTLPPVGSAICVSHPPNVPQRAPGSLYHLPHIAFKPKVNITFSILIRLAQS